MIAAALNCRAAITNPSAVAEPEMCRTANASAIVVTPSPNAEIVVLEKTSLKLRSAPSPYTARIRPDTSPEGLGAAEDWLALLGEGFQPFEVVAAVVGLAAQALDPFVHLRRDGLVVRQDAELFLDDRYGQR